MINLFCWTDPFDKTCPIISAADYSFYSFLLNSYTICDVCSFLGFLSKDNLVLAWFRHAPWPCDEPYTYTWEILARKWVTNVLGAVETDLLSLPFAFCSLSRAVSLNECDADDEREIRGNTWKKTAVGDGPAFTVDRCLKLNRKEKNFEHTL